MSANPGGGDYRPDEPEPRTLGGCMWCNEDGCDHGAHLITPANIAQETSDDRLRESIGRLDARETGTDPGITNLEGELAQLRAEVERLTAITKAQGQNVSWMSYHDAMARGDALSRRALKAEAALTRVRALADEWRDADDTVLTEGAAFLLDVALDGPVTSATSPSPASTGDTGIRAGLAPSDSPSEAQGDEDALTVCVAHLRFVPCRRDDGCRTSQHPDAVDAVRAYQDGA